MKPCAWCTVVAAARLRGLARRPAHSPEIKSLQADEALQAAREGLGAVRAQIIITAARPGGTAVSAAPPTLSTRQTQTDSTRRI